MMRNFLYLWFMITKGVAGEKRHAKHLDWKWLFSRSLDSILMLKSFSYDAGDMQGMKTWMNNFNGKIFMIDQMSIPCSARNFPSFLFPPLFKDPKQTHKFKCLWWWFQGTFPSLFSTPNGALFVEWLVRFFQHIVWLLSNIEHPEMNEWRKIFMMTCHCWRTFFRKEHEKSSKWWVENKKKFVVLFYCVSLDFRIIHHFFLVCNFFSFSFNSFHEWRGAGGRK